MKVAEAALGLVGLDGEAEAGFQDVVGGGHVVAVVAIGLLQTAAAERVGAAQPQADLRAARHERVEDVAGHVDGDVELPAQLAGEGEAMGAGHGISDLDLAPCAEREGVVAERQIDQRRQQLARARPHHAEAGFARR